MLPLPLCATRPSRVLTSCHANRAEYILNVIGAGATAHSETDWHAKWTASREAVELQEELERIHTEGRNRPAVGATYRHEFATSWSYQVAQLFKRDCEAHWRDPTYLISKLALNIVSGLFIGFTFFKAKDSIQGSQNKLFVSCRSKLSCLVIC